MPNPVIAPGVRSSTSAKNASTAATGVVASYTAPANKAAEVVSYFCDSLNAGVAAQFQLVVGGGNFQPETTAGVGVNTRRHSSKLILEGGDVARWNVTTAVLATAADFYIGIISEA